VSQAGIFTDGKRLITAVCSEMEEPLFEMHAIFLNSSRSEVAKAVYPSPNEF
jgi:hypothetical protein